MPMSYGVVKGRIHRNKQPMPGGWIVDGRPYSGLDFHERLSAVVAERGHNPVQAANACHVPCSSMRSWMSGQSVPTLPKLEALCKGLKVSADVLLGLDTRKGGI